MALRKIMLGMIRFCQSVSSSAGPMPSSSERARLSLAQNLHPRQQPLSSISADRALWGSMLCELIQALKLSYVISRR